MTYLERLDWLWLYRIAYTILYPLMAPTAYSSIDVHISSRVPILWVAACCSTSFYMCIRSYNIHICQVLVFHDCWSRKQVASNQMSQCLMACLQLAVSQTPQRRNDILQARDSGAETSKKCGCFILLVMDVQIIHRASSPASTNNAIGEVESELLRRIYCFESMGFGGWVKNDWHQENN